MAETETLNPSTPAPPTRAPAMRAANRGRDTVTIACKLPNGLILRNFKMVKKYEASPMGAREVEVAEQVGDSFTVKGNAVDIAKLMRRDIPNISDGYALTTGCPRDLWEKWLEANADTDMVRNGIIFALPSENDARAWAYEHRSVRSGLEPIDPDNPGRFAIDTRAIQRGKTGDDDE